MAERENLAKSVDLEQVFSRRNPVVEGLLQTGGKIVSPVYDAASYGLNQLGIRTPSFEQATGIKPFGFGPGASGESAFFRSPVQNVPIERRIIPAIPGRPGTEVGVGMPLPPLKQKIDQDNATGTPNVMPYIAAGTDQGQNARERSFLERMAQSGLLSTLQGMARAERMYGVGPLAAFSESALDVQAARSAAEQKQREMGLELAKERIKAGDGSDAIRKMLAKGETQKLLSTAGNTFKMINASEKIRKILGTKGASGLANAAKSWATQFGNIFGFNLEATSRQEVEDIIGTLEQQIAGARIFGRDLSRFDYEVLAKVLKSPGILESDERIRNQYKRLINDLEQTHAQSVKSLNILIGRDTTRQLLRQANTTGNLFTKVE